MPPINQRLTNLEEKAARIVALFQPSGPCIHNCCAAHMVLVLNEPEKVTGWEELAQVQVEQANTSCKDLFGKEIEPRTLGGWIDAEEAKGGWVPALVEGIKAALNGDKIPSSAEPLILQDSGRRVRPIICGVHRRRDEANSLAAVDLLFLDGGSREGMAGRSSDPKLASLALTQHFAIRFRCEVLESFAGRDLQATDVLNFFKKYNRLSQQASHDARLPEPDRIREDVRSFFSGEELTKIDQMFQRWDELSPRDDGGELEGAFTDPARLSDIINEILGLNQVFLKLASAQVAALLAGPQGR